MNDNDKAILKDAAFRLEEVASQLENLSDEARKELEESKNLDVTGEIEHIESMAKDFGETAYKDDVKRTA